jgi:1,4-dihydroxy-2-naphthoate polyprenyltransferase
MRTRGHRCHQVRAGEFLIVQLHMLQAEPSLAALPNPVVRYILATRPPFLAVTFFACLIGLASAWFDGVAIAAVKAFVTVLFALVAHAGVNVLNDYYDALNGTDDINTGRIFPFTGGSRFIQNGVLSKIETARFGAGLFAVTMLAGIWLAQASAAGLFVIGIAGLTIGWAYSAPPLRLNSRGLGELCVAAGFALIVIGADYVQRGALAARPVIAAVPYALLVTNILYINQFPDREADAAAGKRHWVVRLAPDQARWGYLLLVVLAHSWLIGAVLTHELPWTTLIALASVIPATVAARGLFQNYAAPQQLAPAIRATIGAATLHGLLLTVGLDGARLFMVS